MGLEREKIERWREKQAPVYRKALSTRVRGRGGGRVALKLREKRGGTRESGRPHT